MGGAHPGWPCCGGWPQGPSSSICASPPPSCQCVPGSGPTGSPCVTSHWIWFPPSRSICSVTGCALLNSSSHQVPSVGTHGYAVGLRSPSYQAWQSCRAQSVVEFSAEAQRGRQAAPALPHRGQSPHLEVGEVLLHEAVDLTHGQAAGLAALQGHGNQTAGTRDGATNRPQVTA